MGVTTTEESTVIRGSNCSALKPVSCTTSTTLAKVRPAPQTTSCHVTTGLVATIDLMVKVKNLRIEYEAHPPSNGWVRHNADLCNPFIVQYTSLHGPCATAFSNVICDIYLASNLPCELPSIKISSNSE